MNKKAASILLHCGIIGWLIGYLGYDNKADLGGRLITQGLILSIIWMVPFLGYVAGCVFTVLAIVNIAKGDEDYKLPIFGEANWFKQY